MVPRLVFFLPSIQLQIDFDARSNQGTCLAVNSFKPQDCGSMKSLVDPMPIITCSGKNRAGKMSTEITSRGYYSTKNVYYFGLKLHVVAFRRKGIIPFFLKCLYFPLRMKMTQLYCIQKSKVWEIRTIEKYMPIKYIQIYYSIKRRKNAKNFRQIGRAHV